MSQERFDSLTRALATRRISRGRMLKMGATAALGSVLGGRLLSATGPARGCPLDSPELECDLHIYAYPEQNAQLQESRSLQVELQGFNLPGEEKASVEAEIRELVEARVAEYQQPHPAHPAVTRPTTRSVSQPGQIAVSLTGLHLPDTELSRIESRIRRVMAEVTPLGAEAATKTIRAGVFVRSADWPGQPIYLDEWLDCPIFRPAVGEEKIIAVYFREDVFRLTVRNGGEANPPLGPEETTVALARRTAWDKRITWTGPQQQSVWGTKSIDCTNYSGPMRLYDSRTSPPPDYTIVFEKPKFLGQWTSMYHWYPPQFMRVFGGNITRYCWFQDNTSGGSGFNRIFRTSFEPYYGERLPDWTNWLDTPDSIYNVDGPPYCERRQTILDAHVGQNVLAYGGRAKPPGASVPDNHRRFCLFKVFDLHAPIGPETTLVYWIYPRDDLGRSVSLDLVLTDGGRLWSTDAVDQNGYRMSPLIARGRNLPLNQWSPIKCHIGRWLAGKTIDRILVGFYRTEVSGWFSGYIDDILISNNPAARGC